MPVWHWLWWLSVLLQWRTSLWNVGLWEWKWHTVALPVYQQNKLRWLMTFARNRIWKKRWILARAGLRWNPNQNRAFKLNSVTQFYKNHTAATRNKLFKCVILFAFHSNCSIEAELRQAHMGRGVHSLKHLICLCTLDNIILSVKFSFLGSRLM